MPKFTAADVSTLMTDLTKVRNIIVCGGIGQGKTTLLDNFGAQCGLCAEDSIGTTLFSHARADEREKGCTYKSNVSSLVINDMLFHVLDTPGHAEYSAEFQTVLPMADGAVVVADGSGGGMSIQASRQLGDLVAWGIEPILVCNRFDVSLFTTKKSGEEISYDVMQVVEQFNAALDTAVSALGPAPLATPETGRVIFGSLLQGWAFTIPQLAQLYAAKFGSDVDTLSKKLWGEMFFNAKAKKWTKNGDENSTRTFVHFCLNPIMQVLAAAEETNITKIEKMMKAMGVTLESADLKLEGKALFKRVMLRWMPAGMAIAKACEKFIPNPLVAQAKRFPILSEAPPTDPTTLAIKACSKDGPLLFFTSKMTSQPSTPGRFFAIGRVFSGTATADKCYMLDADYKPPHAREEPEA
jgi:elongation factor 2